MAQRTVSMHTEIESCMIIVVLKLMGSFVRFEISHKHSGKNTKKYPEAFKIVKV